MRAIVLISALAIGAAGAAAAVAADRPSDEQRLARMLDGLTPGKPVDCIRQAPTIDSTNFEGAIIYRDGATRYLNRFDNGCPFLDRNNAIVTRTFGGQLCRGDIARIVETFSPIERGSCVFGEFVPYTKPR